MTSDVLISIDNLSKKFCRSLKRSLWYGLQDIAAEASGARGAVHMLRADEFWAVRGISLELARGECLGLIGPNGAGKTTLLKMLNGLIKPDEGRIEIRGQVGALISLGAGFNPILTGRENIYVNAAVLGLSKAQIEQEVEAIIEFAGIRDFIDSPVQNYSSGMQVRLGFAVATALKPDVLILDEVLAVGDAAFRAKCYQRIGQISQHAAIIFVSHSMEAILQFCNAGMCIANGTSIGKVTAEEAVMRYRQLTTDDASVDGSFTRHIPDIQAIRLSATEVPIHIGGTLVITMRMQCRHPIHVRSVRVEVYRPDAGPVAEWNSLRQSNCEADLHDDTTLEIRLRDVRLLTGQYLLSILVYGDSNVAPLVWSYKELMFTVSGPAHGWHAYQLEGTLQVSVSKRAYVL